MANYVKDIENKSWLDTKLQSEAGLDNFNFDEFDKNIENSFQNDFLNSEKIKEFTGQAQSKTIQWAFNEWLDEQYESLDKMKNIEIDNTIVKETTFELWGFNTLIELEAFQKKLNEEKEESETTETIEIWSADIKLDFYNEVTAEQVSSVINWSSFEWKREIIDLLTQKKVKELQQKIWGTKWDLISWSVYKYEFLPTHWDDWMFGKETFDALKKYIKDNPATEDEVTPNPSPTATSNSSAEEIEEYFSNNWSEVGDNFEVLSSGDLYFSFDQWEEQTLWPKLPDWLNNANISTIPPSNRIMGDLEIKDNKLVYTWNVVGQETMRVIIHDNNWKEIFNKSITIDVNWIEWDNIDEFGNASYMDVFRNTLRSEGNWNLDKEIDVIVNEISDLKQVYLKLDEYSEAIDLLKANRQLSETEEKKREAAILIESELKSLFPDIDFEDNDDLFEDLRLEKQKIENNVDELLKMEAERELRLWLKKLCTGDDIIRKELANELNDNVLYYMDWEYLDSGEKFLDNAEKQKYVFSNIRFVNLNISFEKWSKDYLKDKDSKTPKNWEIDSLIITNDPNFGLNRWLSNDQEIQYKGEAYGDVVKWDNEMNREKQAIKNILWIKWLFGRGWVDENMSIATEDYETNNPVFKERKNLRKLKRILLDFIDEDNKDISVEKAFKEVNSAYLSGKPLNTENKKQEKLLELYTMYKKWEGWDYFVKAMWLLENYFVLWIKDFDVENDPRNMFRNLYKEENIWRVEWLIDPDKQRKAIKTIFKDLSGKNTNKNNQWKTNIDLWVDFAPSDGLKDLHKIVKKIDLSIILSDWDRSKKWKEFMELYDKYKDALDENPPKIVDGVPAIYPWVEPKFSSGSWTYDSDYNEAMYYNKVFDFLAGVAEGRQDIVKAVNWIKVMDDVGDFVVEGTDKDYFEVEDGGISNEKEFVTYLSDLNLDGRIDSGDRWMRMWLEIKDIYKSVKVDQQYLAPKSDKLAYQNFLEFAELHTKSMWNEALLLDLQNCKDWNEFDLSELNDEINKNTWLQTSLQNLLVNSPIPIEYIFKYGIDANEYYFKSWDADVLSSVLSGTIEIEWAEEKLDEEIKKLISQWLIEENIPELRTVLRPMFYAAMLRQDAVTYGYWWAWLSLTTKEDRTFSMNLAYGDVPGAWDNGSVQWVLWIMMSASKSWETWDNSSVNAWLSVWAPLDKDIFVPIASAWVGFEHVIKRDKLDNDLKPRSVKKFNASANIMITTWLSLWAWFDLGLSWDEMEWINQQYKNIERELGGTNWVLYDVLTNTTFEVNRDHMITKLKLSLQKRFGEADTELLTRAADNIYQALLYYTNSKWELDLSESRLPTIIRDISSSYALAWKNKAVRWASDVDIESVWVGVRFLAGFYPIPVANIKLSWYDNLYSKETNESVADYYSQLASWMGMERAVGQEEFYEDWNMTPKAAEYLNAKMNIAHPQIDTPNLDVVISNAQLENNDWGDPIKQSLYIPVELYKYVNINIDPSLLNYVDFCDVGSGIPKLEKDKQYIEIPLNTKIALLDYSRTNTKRFNLIIWDTKAGLDDLKVGPDTDLDKLDGNPTKFENVDYRYMTSEKINSKILELENIEMVSESWDVVTEVINPLDKCVVENGEAKFSLKKDMFEKCIDVWWSYSDLRLENNQLIIPQFGTLTMYYNEDGKYEMYYSSKPSDQLNIAFDVQRYKESVWHWVDWEIIEENWESWKPFEKDFDNIDLFDKYSEFNEIFDGIEDDLSTMDDKYWNVSGPYASLMNAAVDADLDGLLEGSDYDKAMEELATILLDNKDFKDENIFDSLRDKIFDQNNNLRGDLSIEDKVMIIDRFKAIFSYHIDRSNFEDLPWYVKNREWYMNLLWYDKKTKYPLENTYKKEILRRVEAQDDISRKHVDNLFGMTSFYRLEEWVWKSFSMTQMWSTNVLWWEMVNIEDVDDLKATKEWFWNNLDKSWPHKDILVNSLVDKINIDFVTKDFLEENLESLLRWDRIDIGDGNNKIKLNLNYVFYLLGECANESIWVELEWVEVREKVDNSNSSQTGGYYEYNDWRVDWDWQIVRIPSDTENLAGWIYHNTQESLQEEWWAKKPWIGVGGAAAWNKPQEYVPNWEANANNWANNDDVNNWWNNNSANWGTDDDTGSWSTYWWSGNH